MLKILAIVLKFLPYVIQGVEVVHGPKAGKEKLAAAEELADRLLPATGVVKDLNSWQEGRTAVINGIVKMLNASEWAK